jgi:hypothetical protein
VNVQIPPCKCPLPAPCKGVQGGAGPTSGRRAARAKVPHGCHMEPRRLPHGRRHRLTAQRLLARLGRDAAALRPGDGYRLRTRQRARADPVRRGQCASDQPLSSNLWDQSVAADVTDRIATMPEMVAVPIGETAQMRRLVEFASDVTRLADESSGRRSPTAARRCWSTAAGSMAAMAPSSPSAARSCMRSAAWIRSCRGRSAAS